MSDGIDTAAQGLQIRIRFVVKVSFITQTEKRKALKTLISFLQSWNFEVFQGENNLLVYCQRENKGWNFRFWYILHYRESSLKFILLFTCSVKTPFLMEAVKIVLAKQIFHRNTKINKRKPKKGNTKENHPKIFFGYFRGKTFVYTHLYLSV